MSPFPTIRMRCCPASSPLLPLRHSAAPLLLLLGAAWLSSAGAQTGRTALLASLFNANYDNSLRPLVGTGRPVAVAVNYRIDLLYGVSSADETFALDFFMSERWVDPRLQFNSSRFPLPSGDILRLPSDSPWRPDTYFFNSIRCAVSDSLLKLDPAGSGLVTWTRHQTCTFYTPFDLQQFPFDSQALPIQRLSFFYNSTELALSYSDLGCFQPDPRLDYSNALWDLPSYECDVTRYNGVQDELVSWLYVQRKWQAYVLKMIVPMFLIVIVSSFSYFVDPAAAPARVGLSVAIVLTVSTFNLLVSQDLPKINYSTLLDWYVWKCFLFVIAAVAEFAFVNHLLVSKSYPPLVARLVDDFFQWTVPVVWGLSNLIYWPILPSSALDAFFGVLLVAYIALNAYRIAWCYRHDKLGMVQPVKALYRWTKAYLDEADRLAKEQIEKNSGHLAKLGIHTAANRTTAAARGRGGRTRRGRGAGRGRSGTAAAAAGRDRLDVDADGEEGGEGIDLAVIVTPPTPHGPHERALEAGDGHERALRDVDEEDEEAELQLSDTGQEQQQSGGTIDSQDDEEAEVEEAAGAVQPSRGKRRRGSLLYSTAAQEDDDEQQQAEEEAVAEVTQEANYVAEASLEAEHSGTGEERLLVSSADSSSQLRSDESEEHDGGGAMDDGSAGAKHVP